MTFLYRCGPLHQTYKPTKEKKPWVSFYRSVVLNIVSFLLFESVVFFFCWLSVWWRSPQRCRNVTGLTSFVRIKKKFCLSLCQYRRCSFRSSKGLWIRAVTHNRQSLLDIDGFMDWKSMLNEFDIHSQWVGGGGGGSDRMNQNLATQKGPSFQPFQPLFGSPVLLSNWKGDRSSLMGKRGQRSP